MNAMFLRQADGTASRANRLARVALLSVAAVVLFGALSGCASVRKHKAVETEQMLAEAGFSMKLADTPERLAHLQTLPQRKLRTRPANGGVSYFYADASGCKCLYQGSQEAYKTFQELELQQRIASGEVETREVSNEGSMNWGVWGSYGD